MQALDLVGAGQNARAAGGRAARHAAAGIHDLPVERDDTRAAAGGSRHPYRVVQRLGNDRPPQQIFHDALVFCLKRDQRRRDADKAALRAELIVRHPLAGDGAERQKGRAAAVAALEELNGGLAVVVRVHNDVLHRRAKCGLYGRREFVVRMDERGDRPVYAAKRTARGLLHHELDCLGKALEIALHLAQHPQLRIRRSQLDFGIAHLLFQPVALFRPGLQAKRIAGDHIVRRRDVFLRLGKTFFALRRLLLHILPARQRGCMIRFQRLLPFEDVRKCRPDGADLRPPSGCLRGQQRMIRAQTEELSRRLVVRLRQLFALFERCAELFVDPRQLNADLPDARLLGLDLPCNAAAAALLIGQLLPHAVDIRFVVVDRCL